jgi:hypothetical protein
MKRDRKKEKHFLIILCNCVPLPFSNFLVFIIIYYQCEMWLPYHKEPAGLVYVNKIKRSAKWERNMIWYHYPSPPHPLETTNIRLKIVGAFPAVVELI